MITNELLIMKSQTQKKLNEMAQNNLVKYVENSHLNVQQTANQLGLTLNYGQPGKISKRGINKDQS